MTSPRASYCYSFRHFHFILKSEFQNHSLIWPNKTNTPNNVQHRESSSFLIILSVCELLAFVEMYRLMLERNPCENLKKRKKKVCISVVLSRGSEELGCSSELPIKFTILRPAAGDAPQIQAASRREERLPLVACAPRVAVSAAAGGV